MKRIIPKFAQCSSAEVTIDIHDSNYDPIVDRIEKEENERCLSLMIKEASDNETKN